MFFQTSSPWIFFLDCLFILTWRNIFVRCEQNLPLYDLGNSNYKILLDADDFRTLRLYGSVFVDKSEMLNEYLERGGVVLIITRPRKWGKSVNLQMFRRFFEIEVDELGNEISDEDKVNRILFTGGSVKLNSESTRNLDSLKITQFVSAMEHQGQNPVILVSFKEVDGATYEEFENAIWQKVKQCYQHFSYLKPYMNKSTENAGKYNDFVEIDVQKSLYFLSKLLFKHFKKNVYIFIDDFDTPIVNAYIKFGYKSNEFKKVTEITYKIIKRAFKDNWYLERGILTGTFHFGWINEILSLHNVRHSTIVDVTFSPFYGFNEEEVKSILTKMPLPIDLNLLKEWYNGYNTDGKAVYNPWSTLSCIGNGGKAESYWASTASPLLDRVYQLDSVQEYLHQLLQGKTVARKDINKPINLANIEDTFHRVLLFGGYFYSVSASCEANCYNHPWNLSLPNREVRGMMTAGVAHWVANKLSITVSDYNNLLKLMIKLQIDDFRDALQMYLLNSSLPKTSIDQQNVLHQLMSGIFSSLAETYTIESSRKPGQKGREYTLMTYPDLGGDLIIIEYEVTKSHKKALLIVETGMKRLLSKQYGEKINRAGHIKRLAKIYIVVNRRKVAIKYQVSDVG